VPRAQRGADSYLRTVTRFVWPVRVPATRWLSGRSSSTLLRAAYAHSGSPAPALQSASCEPYLAAWAQASGCRQEHAAPRTKPCGAHQLGDGSKPTPSFIRRAAGAACRLLSGAAALSMAAALTATVDKQVSSKHGLAGWVLGSPLLTQKQHHCCQPHARPTRLARFNRFEHLLPSWSFLALLRGAARTVIRTRATAAAWPQQRETMCARTA
jgi:hypothetical protein